YLFVNCAALICKQTPGGTVIESDQDLVLYLLDEASVATIQGSAYGASPYFRISFAASKALLEKAAAQIAAAVERLS
ncbi:MAG: aspartate transaminase, partial [Rhodococcus sp. (in: high G+C Gram-positive bacteria)]